MSCYIQSSHIKRGGKVLRCPLLVDGKHRIIEPVSSYIRYLATVRMRRPNSVQKYAELLLHFCQYLSRKLGAPGSPPETRLGKAQTVSAALFEVTNAHLEEWLDLQEKAGNKLVTQNGRLDTVFLFYVWMQVRGMVEYAVRIPNVNDHEKFTPSLGSKPARRTSANRRPSEYGIVSDLRRRGPAQEMLPTPDQADMTSLYAACTRLFGQAVAERNQLMLRWYQHQGIRRFEWAALTLKLLPPWEELMQRCANFESVPIRLVVTKGGRVQAMSVLPELLELTHEYIQGERAAIVEECKNRKKKEGEKNYIEPEEVFLSSTNGRPLNLRSISNILKQIFVEAGVEGHGHRIRAFFLQNAAHAEADAEHLAVRSSGGRKAGMDWMGVGLRLAEKGRVRHVTSLAPYIGSVQKQFNREPEQDEYLTLNAAVEAKRQELEIVRGKLAVLQNEHEALQGSVDAMKTARKNSGRSRLKTSKSALGRGRVAS